MYISKSWYLELLQSKSSRCPRFIPQETSFLCWESVLGTALAILNAAAIRHFIEERDEQTSLYERYGKTVNIIFRWYMKLDIYSVRIYIYI